MFIYIGFFVITEGTPFDTKPGQGIKNDIRDPSFTVEIGINAGYLKGSDAKSSLSNVDYVDDKSPSFCNENIFQNEYFIAMTGLCIGLFVIVLILSFSVCLLVKHISRMKDAEYGKVIQSMSCTDDD